MRLIDADALLEDIDRTIENSGCVNHEGEILDSIRYSPTIDAVEVVRCKDCKHAEKCINVFKDGNPTLVCEFSFRHLLYDEFCSQGERKESCDE